MRSQISLRRTLFIIFALASLAVLFASCGGGGGGGGGFFPPPTGGTRYTITGTVTDGTNGLAGVIITISGTGTGTINTDANGNFTLSNLQPGTYTLTPSKTNSQFNPPSRTVTLSANTAGADFTLTVLVQGDASEGSGGSTTDNTPATAGPITIDVTQLRTIYPDGDVDWVKINFPVGGDYEFSANKLSNASDVVMSLYNCLDTTTPLVNGPATPLVDDYIGFDSRILYMVLAAGDYCLEVKTGNWSGSVNGNGIATYTLGVHPFVDNDGDLFSNYYDCDDTVATGGLIGPLSPVCSGITSIDPLTEDSIDAAGDDGTRASAVSMNASGGDGWELYLRSDIAANARTIYPSGDVDYFSISIPGKSSVLVHAALTDMTDGANSVIAEAFTGAGVPVAGPAVLSQNIISGINGLLQINNTSAQAATFFVKFSGPVLVAPDTHTGYYVPFYYNIGDDVDSDGYYTQDWPGYRDCNDSSASINPGAADPAGGADQNCNGVDGS